MKYIALVYYQEEVLDALPVEEHAEIIRECHSWLEGLERAGRHVYSAGLQCVRTATTVAEREGTLTMTDGPFAETKEVLGGFTVFEAKDLNEAVRVASELPATRIGKVEIRPVMDPLAEPSDPLDRKIVEALRLEKRVPA